MKHKFRAWDKKKSEFVMGREGFSLHGETFFLWGFDSQRKSGDGDVGEYVNRIVFQQATGINDKDGKEIYEGDILNVHEGADNWRHCEVYADSGAFWLGNELLYLHRPNLDMAIVGNVFENPSPKEK